jgi:hypothetical protein
MENYKATLTPINTNGKLPGTSGTKLANPSEYRSLAVPHCDEAQLILLRAADPHECHLTMFKMILRYVRGTTSLILHLHASSSFTLTAYTDADWAGCPDTRYSTSSYCAFLGKSLMSWSSKRQAKVSRSSMEA